MPLSSRIHHLVAPQCCRCATQKPIIRHHLQQLERTQIHGRDSRHPRTATSPPSPSTTVSSLKQFHHHETIYHRESENQLAKKSKIAQSLSPSFKHHQANKRSSSHRECSCTTTIQEPANNQSSCEPDAKNPNRNPLYDVQPPPRVLPLSRNAPRNKQPPLHCDAEALQCRFHQIAQPP
ncbi:hypothetical protein LR48_Vigan01g041300 [Vigna angularis]|uniref:Uncharacterized protein n=1 Tax=Phaseolus angularis TaxID=3914 RepID=A0A0L9TJR1_PHAAN|nr:hypothetical protein LR48_Vigan01g041300 [Vigna angularis]